jgi:hypothetical protein
MAQIAQALEERVKSCRPRRTWIEAEPRDILGLLRARRAAIPPLCLQRAASLSAFEAASAEGALAGIDQHSEAGRLGQERMHESEPLRVDFEDKKIDPSRVATRPCEARNEAQRHRVLSHAEHNRDRCRCRFGGKRSRGAAGCGNHGHAALDVSSNVGKRS